MSSLRVCTAVILIVALAAPAFGSLDDFLFGAFCNRPDIEKLITICYTPTPVANAVQADDVDAPAFSAAARGSYYGTSSGGTVKQSTFFVVAVDKKVIVKCTVAKENAEDEGVKLLGVDGLTKDVVVPASPPTADLTGSLTSEKGMAITVTYSSWFTCSWAPAA